jgi:CubicO group peptidase (beta-lactamase class C family)
VIRERIQAAFHDAGVPGAVLARVSPSGIQDLEAVGFSDLSTRREVTETSAFHLYSGTKLFTASAAMLLVERGELEIDADVRPRFPELALAYPVTPRQLLSHSSGLNETLRAFVAIHTPAQRRPSTFEALQRYDLGRGKPPGGRARYRNANYALLGELIARIAGVPYETLVRTALLEPWGAHAAFESAEVDDLATGYVRRLDPMRLAAPFLLGRRGAAVFDGRVGRYVALRRFDLDTAAAGGLIGVAADFAPLVAEFLGDADGVLRATTRRAMLTRVATGAVGVVSRDGVGLGWKRGDVDGVRFWNHEGGGPGFCSELRIYPERRLGFVVLTNLSQSRRLSRAIHAVCEQLR